MRLDIRQGSDPGVRAQCPSPGIPRGRRLRGKEKTLALGLVFRVTTTRHTPLGMRTQMVWGVAVTTLRHQLQGYLLDLCLLRLDPLLGIMDIPLA